MPAVANKYSWTSRQACARPRRPARPPDKRSENRPPRGQPPRSETKLENPQGNEAQKCKERGQAIIPAEIQRQCRSAEPEENHGPEHLGAPERAHFFVVPHASHSRLRVKAAEPAVSLPQSQVRLRLRRRPGVAKL